MMKSKKSRFKVSVVMLLLITLVVGIQIFKTNHRQKVITRTPHQEKISKKELAKRMSVEQKEVEDIENHVDLSKNVRIMKGHFNKKIDGLLSTTLYRPTAKKVILKEGAAIQLKIPYKLSLPSYFPKDEDKAFKRRVTDFIRVESGGTVWSAAPGKKHLISNRNKTETGTAIINMFIQRGYSEDDLQKYQVKLVEPTGSDVTLLYHMS